MLAQHHRRHETMDMVEEGQFQIGLTAERLQAAAGIPDAILEQAGAQPVRKARRQPLADIVLARGALSLHQTEPRIAALERRKQQRDLVGRVLAVPVQGHDHRRARLPDAMPNGTRLSPGMRMGQYPQPWIPHRQGLKGLIRAIFRAVIDGDHLKTAISENNGNLVDQWGYRRLFIAQGDHDAQVECVLIHSAAPSSARVGRQKSPRWPSPDCGS